MFFKSKSVSLSDDNTLFASLILNLFSYKALPTITPKSPEFSNFTKDNKSDIEPTPPEAITGISVISRILFMNPSFVPSNVPSVFISVTIKLAI